MMAREMLAKRLFCTFLIGLLLLSNIGFAFSAQSHDTGTEAQTAPEKTEPWNSETLLLLAPEPDSAPDVQENGPETETTVKRADFTCANATLDPANVQRLYDEVLNKGVTADKISSDAEAKDAQELEDERLVNNKIAQPLTESTLAREKSVPQEQQDTRIPVQVQQLPDIKGNPQDFSYLLNSATSGPFQFGIVLDDSMRMGVCRNFDGREYECPLIGKNLGYRNSGEGIIADFKSVTGDIKEMFGGKSPSELTDEEYSEFREEMGLSEKAAETLQDSAMLEEESELKAKTYKRVENQIPNSIFTEDFEAEMGSTCSSNDCLISSYSMFDKYYNSWFAADLVISNFGPTLWGAAKKMYGWTVHRVPGADILDNRFTKWFRNKFYSNEGLLGEARIANINTRFEKSGLSDIKKKLMEPTEWDGGYTFIKGGGFRKWWNEEMAVKGGYLDKITDAETRGELFKIVRDMGSWAKTNKAAFEIAQADYFRVAKRFGQGSAEEVAARIDFAKQVGKQMGGFDSAFKLDFPEYWVRDEQAGLFKYAVRDPVTNDFYILPHDSVHIGNIVNNFAETGSFAGLRYQTDAAGNLLLYGASPKARLIQDNVPVEDLTKHFAQFREKTVFLPDKGEYIPLNSTTLDYIKGNATGSVQIYDAGWEVAEHMTPYELSRRMTHDRIYSRLAEMPAANTETMYRTLQERNFADQSRRFYSALDKAMREEEHLVRSYFTIKGGAKWTVAPFVYWGFKRGFGSEDLSGYMLPQQWTDLKMYIDEQSVYDDSYVDFFANEGSDEGDIFAQLLNKLPWKLVIDKLSELYKPAQETLDKLTGKGWRSTVENLAYFTATEEDCDDCMVRLGPSLQLMTFAPVFDAKNVVKSYIVEDTVSDEAREDGPTLIAFAHSTNLKGSSTASSESGEPIDLIEARNDKETCRDKVEALGFGWVGKPSRVGGALAFGESLAYFAFGWYALIGSAVQQIYFAAELQDCVDDAEGYFVHFFVPIGQNTQASAEPAQKATTDVLGQLKVNVSTLLAQSPEQAQKEQSAGPFYKSLEAGMEKISESVNRLNQQNEQTAILQARLELNGYSHGNMVAPQLFFFWHKGNSQPSSYRLDGKKVLDTNEGKIVADFEKGELSIIDKSGQKHPIIEGKNEEEKATVRKSDYTTNIPAYRIPQRETNVGLTGSESIVFEMNTRGDLIVVDSSVADCIRQGVMHQTGVELASDNLVDAFGALKAIETDSHPSITADEAQKRINAEGTPRQQVHGDSAKAIVKANAQVELHNSQTIKVGKLNSIRFSNGFILYKPSTNELLVHLYFHEASVLNRNDVEGIKVKPATVTNPLTDCPEPAIDMEAMAKAGSDKIAQKVSNFNASIEKMGPFQIIDTDRHRFIFYSKKTTPDCDPAEPECCKSYFKSIDKETGEVYEAELDGPLQATDKGIAFKTMDGVDHTLDFFTENGQPKLSYDKGNPETIRAMQGQNGSFWYDPDTGLWHPENSQLIPLIEAIKQNGLMNRVGDDGKAAGTAGAGPLSINIGGGEQGFLPSLPSLPQGMALLLFFASLLGIITVFRAGVYRKKDNAF